MLGSVWVVNIELWWCCGILWLSSDEHGDGNIVVVGDVFSLISLLLSNGLEGVVSNDLSEGLEGDGLNVIKFVGWGNLEGKSSLLINWDGNKLLDLLMNWCCDIFGSRNGGQDSGDCI